MATLNVVLGWPFLLREQTFFAGKSGICASSTGLPNIMVMGANNLGRKHMSKTMRSLAAILTVIFAVSLSCGCVVYSIKKRTDRRRQIAALESAVGQLEEAAVQRQKSLALWYNLCLRLANPPKDHEDSYGEILNISDGIMGYMEFPSLRLSLPVYHGAGHDLDDAAIGHVSGSSLPIGGSGTHGVFLAPGEVASLKEGDILAVHILKEIHVYQVQQVREVSPGYTWGLSPQKGEDLCTLVAGVTRGMENRKVIIRASRMPAEQEQAAIDALGQKRTLDRSGLEKAAYAMAGVLLLPVLTGCIGRGTGWILRICCRSSKSRKKIA